MCSVHQCANSQLTADCRRHMQCNSFGCSCATVFFLYRWQSGFGIYEKGFCTRLGLCLCTCISLSVMRFHCCDCFHSFVVEFARTLLDSASSLTEAVSLYSFTMNFEH